jgi:hypothetical protein
MEHFKAEPASSVRTMFKLDLFCTTIISLMLLVPYLLHSGLLAFLIYDVYIVQVLLTPGFASHHCCDGEFRFVVRQAASL